MIRIHYAFDQHHHLHITGHAGYAPPGCDIVCAGVSAVACALTEYLKALDAVEEAHCGPGELRLQSMACDEAAVAFDMALTGWKCIEKTYPQCVEVHTPI